MYSLSSPSRHLSSRSDKESETGPRRCDPGDPQPEGRSRPPQGRRRQAPVLQVQRGLVAGAAESREFADIRNRESKQELTRQVYAVELCAYLGGLEAHKSSDSALFMTIEEVGKFLESMYSLRHLGVAHTLCLVPANVKGEDVFHLTVEEYLLALISVVEELVCFQLI